MRTIQTLTSARFAKAAEALREITLPHTWNALDGQDGGGDYWRGTGYYEIPLPAPTTGKRQYIEFRGANHIAKVSCNGKELGTHKGGFSTFRYELTDILNAEDNLLKVEVFNGDCDVYPQNADFTFFGGLYRSVNFLEVENAHFDLMKTGSNAVFVTPHVTGRIRVDAFPVNYEGCSIVAAVYDAEGNAVASAKADAEDHTVLVPKIKKPHLWDGLKDPYCYTLEVKLMRGKEEVDCVTELFGIRSFHVDPNTGFWLNGKNVPLRGVARHQDRENMGWALSKAEHAEDVALIRELGANTIRLAHYQHDQYFYELCDKTGFVIWAEIPFITRFRTGADARENTLSQMKELIAQNYNHPSICFWGISNEISVSCETEELYQNLCALNAYVRKTDPSRLTTMAQVSMLQMESEHNDITDVVSYNHYFGWYMGDVSENGSWLDQFHALYPSRSLGVSEYGAEANLALHTAKPESHDYTEEYQAYYHHEMLKCFEARPYLWSTHCWNMFDFAADSRDEGGCKGRNNKGLITYDRKTKKEAFYIYQAYWSDVPMVHVCGERFVDRAPDERNIIVYTNCDAVTLVVNGVDTATKKAVDHAAVFENVALRDGTNSVTAYSGEVKGNVITLNAVEQPNETYALPKDETVAGNWFDDISSEAVLEFPEGYFNIKDTVGSMMDHPEASLIIQDLFEKMFAALGGGEDMKKNIEMCRNMALEPLLVVCKAPKGTDAYLNEKLNKIPKED